MKKKEKNPKTAVAVSFIYLCLLVIERPEKSVESEQLFRTCDCDRYFLCCSFNHEIWPYPVNTATPLNVDTAKFLWPLVAVLTEFHWSNYLNETTAELNLYAILVSGRDL